MSFLPKTKYSGFIIIVILFLILALGFLLVHTRNQNEQQLINRAFIRLRQNSVTITSKIREYSRMYETMGCVNPKPNTWAMKGYVIKIDTGNNARVLANKAEDVYSFSTKRFFSDIIDRSIFDEYCVFSANELFFKTFQVEAKSEKDYLGSLTNNLYMPENYHIFSRKKDSLLMRSSMNTGFISKTYINYNKYYQFVYPMRVNDQIWYIGGLISEKNYTAKKQHVEPWVLILIGILLVFTFFSFQFFKLLLLTKTERIRTMDTVLICLSISGLACIVPLLIINLFTVTGIQMNTDRQLIELNNSIKSGFVNELKLMYNATLAYEKMNKDSTPALHILSSEHLSIDSNTIKEYPYFKGLFCTSIKRGQSDKIISTWEDVTSSRIIYRQYVRKNGEWRLPSTSGDKRFRLESIYSNTSGDVMAVLSRPSDSWADSLFCVSSIMYSLINTVLPPGFEFRIIGRDGQVWFHSDPKKNNRENFLEECENSGEIREAIHNRVSTNVLLQISPKNYRAYISPIGTIPLYLVTLSDTREQNEFLSHVNYMILIFILIGLFCALISTGIFYYEQLGIAFNGGIAHDAEPGLIWLLPDLRKNERYMTISGLNLLLGVLMIIPVFSRRTTELHFLFILIALYSLFFMYCYFLLKTFKIKIFKWSIITTFSVILVSCNILYGIYLPHQFLFIVLEIIAIMVVSAVVYRKLRDRHFYLEDFRETDFPDPPAKYADLSAQPHLPYVLFVYSWITIAAILPTLLLFKISGREEVELITKKNQLELASKIDRKNFQIDSLYIAHIYTNGKNDGRSIAHNSSKRIDIIKEDLKMKGNYFVKQYSQANNGVFMPQKSHSNKPDSNYIILSRKLRQMFGAEDIRSFEMLYGIGSDSAWYWDGGYLSRENPDSLRFYYSATKKSADSAYSAYQIMLSSDLLNQKTNPRSFGARFHLIELLIIFMFMVMLFFLIRRVIIKLFILEKPLIPNLIQIKEVLEEKSRVFIVNALHQEKIKELINKPYSILDSNNNEAIKASEINLIIINTIPKDLKHWMELYNRINGLIKEKPGQIIVLSCYSPRQLIEMADESIQAVAKEKNPNPLFIVKQNYLQLLSEFAVYYYELDSLPDKLPEGLDAGKISKEIGQGNEIIDFLKKEFKFIGYSGGMNKRIEEIILNEKEIERLKPRLYKLFTTKYQFIWERCTINEKFIMFDLALDSVVNTKNMEDIHNLIGKGILEVKGRLDFTSRGFKQFVLDLSGTDVFQALQKDTKRTDGWNKIKVPIYIIFGAVVIFFFLTMQDVVSGMITTILSLGGLFTALWKLGLFGKSAQSGN
jgi:hypothetical protein